MKMKNTLLIGLAWLLFWALVARAQNIVREGNARFIVQSTTLIRQLLTERL